MFSRGKSLVLDGNIARYLGASTLLGYWFLYSVASFYWSLLANWYLEFCEDSMFTGFSLLSGFLLSLLLFFSLSPLTLQSTLTSRTVFDRNFCWEDEWQQHSSGLCSYQPESPLLLYPRTFTFYSALPLSLTCHSPVWMALHGPCSSLTPIHTPGHE